MNGEKIHEHKSPCYHWWYLMKGINKRWFLWMTFSDHHLLSKSSSTGNLNCIQHVCNLIWEYTQNWVIKLNNLLMFQFKYSTVTLEDSHLSLIKPPRFTNHSIARFKCTRKASGRFSLGNYLSHWRWMMGIMGDFYLLNFQFFPLQFLHLINFFLSYCIPSCFQPSAKGILYQDHFLFPLIFVWTLWNRVVKVKLR